MSVVSRHSSGCVSRFVVYLVILGAIGCSGRSEDFPDLLPVTGTVTLDGQPLVGAQLKFEPQSGPGSLAETDEAGKYEAIYQVGVKGAVAGTHTVRISKNASEDPADLSGEVIPARYNRNSDLTITVREGGENQFDFALESK